MTVCDPFVANHSTTEVSNVSLIESFWSEWGEEEENIIGQYYQSTWSKDLFSITEEINQQYSCNWSDDREAFEEAFNAEVGYIESLVECLKKTSAEKEVQQSLEMYSHQVINDQSYEMLYLQHRSQPFEAFHYSERTRRYGGY